MGLQLERLLALLTGWLLGPHLALHLGHLSGLHLALRLG